MPTRSIRLPDRFYLPRIDAQGREVRDVMPWDGAVSYATDGARVGIQYADGRVVWLGDVGAMDATPRDSAGAAPVPLEEDFDGVNLDALVDGLREYMERHPVLKNVWHEDVARLDALRRQSGE